MASSLIGQRLGPYEIETLLGSGGMGEVYRARDTKLAREVAIKILPDAFVADPDRLVRFEREARVLAALNHPHIGAIYGFEDRDGVHALVLELVEGETLAERLAHGAVPMPIALAIARQIADALEAAHDRSIVHRDLKPANVILQTDGPVRANATQPDPLQPAFAGPPISRSGPRPSPLSGQVIVKVIDFGLAKDNDDARHHLTHLSTLNVGRTSAGVILGTAGYMSPEQARGGVVDRRTDIWAFGCILYELMTGRTAFAAETLSDTLVAVLERQPDWSLLPSSTPPAVRRLLGRCLEKDPKRRLHDIADARFDIEEALSDAPSASRFSTRAGRRLQPGTRRLVIAAAAAAAVVGVVSGSLLIRGRSTAAPAPLPLARLMIALPPAESLQKGRLPPLALSPDGRLLAYAASDGGPTHLYVRPLDDLAARQIPESENASTPFFSPDGRWLAFYVDGTLKKISVSGGVPLAVCEAPPVWSAHWGPNDTIVFATTLPRSGLWSVSANGGEPVQVTTPKPGEVQHGYPQWLPGGRDVLFSIRRDNGWQLAQLSLTTREWRLLGNGRIIGEGAQYLPTGHVVYAQSGGLIATAFDPSTGTLDQPPVSLLERLDRSEYGGMPFAVAARAGTLVYLPANAIGLDRTLVRVDRNGRASPLVDARAAYEQPALSKDGRQVAVTVVSEAGHDIWIIDLERSARVRLTTGGTSAFPLWSPDGTKIAFQSTARGAWNLFFKSAAEGADAQPFLTNPVSLENSPWPNSGAALLPGTVPKLSGANPQFPASWSPDGSTLAFHERKPSGERDIWTVSPEGDPRAFLLTPFDERLPRFSPDGKWLAYVSNEGGRDDVYVQPYPGPGAKWLISTDGGSEPVWSRDGREIFYRHDDQVMHVAVSTANGFVPGRPAPLFELPFERGDDGANYDISPDGRWFVLPRGGRRPAPTELHIVLNWFAEVAARTDSRPTDRSAAAMPARARLVARAAAVARIVRRASAALAVAAHAQTPPGTTEEAVRELLQRYSAALESLDANAVKKVQPSIPVDALAKAFRDMRELKVAIDTVKVLSIDGSTARVSCRVTQTLTPKAGAKQTTAVTRVMRLHRTAEAWVIDAFER